MWILLKSCSLFLASYNIEWKYPIQQLYHVIFINDQFQQTKSKYLIINFKKIQYFNLELPRSAEDYNMFIHKQIQVREAAARERLSKL